MCVQRRCSKKVGVSVLSIAGLMFYYEFKASRWLLLSLVIIIKIPNVLLQKHVFKLSGALLLTHYDSL